MLRKIEDLTLLPAETAKMNAMLQEAALMGRSGAISLFIEARSLGWCGVVISGQLEAQLMVAAQSAEQSNAMARLLADTVAMRMREAEAEKVSEAAILRAKH